MIERISDIAIILRSSHSKDGIEFLTPPDYPLQLGYMRRAAGYIVKPHVHTPVERQTFKTQESLFVRSGRIRVRLYDDDSVHIATRILYPLDVIHFSGGGHGIEFMEQSEIVECKSGPHVADDKRFI
jgi:hypothetical protein